MNKLAPTDGRPMTVYEKKNVICIDVVQNSSGAGQNTRNIYKIYNKKYVIAFKTTNFNVDCESELKKVK